jgi:hypothetical protein
LWTIMGGNPSLLCINLAGRVILLIDLMFFV